MRQGRSPVRYGAMPSTVIRRFMYVPGERELTIEFVTGRRYRYFGVPSDTVDAFRAASSKGVYFNRNIRDIYRFRELAGTG